MPSDGHPQFNVNMAPVLSRTDSNRMLSCGNYGQNSDTEILLPPNCTGLPTPTFSEGPNNDLTVVLT